MDLPTASAVGLLDEVERGAAVPARALPAPVPPNSGVSAWRGFGKPQVTNSFRAGHARARAHVLVRSGSDQMLCFASCCPWPGWRCAAVAPGVGRGTLRRALDGVGRDRPAWKMDCSIGHGLSGTARLAVSAYISGLLARAGHWN